ncbi:MAG: sugar ABC transporter permease [Bacilli bacterium]|jgi:ABC-type sugar transport system permease subunit|nr:sugar ABC transporter permease [Bacilli bacterium]MDD3098920.1 sugar ABC transporter permease [Bacilli bacterium]MDD4303169.1 sugar ABC transporter permease [Bacilli bacterium]MDY0345061.1 sugar ABC transporter permease [Bacilli bacterium]
MKNTSVKKIPKKKSEIWIALLFSSLWIIGFLVFSLYPLIQSLLFSFNQVNVTPTEIVQTNVGFENFRAVLFDDPDFRNALRTYLIQMVVYVPIIIVVSLVIALLLNTIRKGKGFFRTIFFLPVIISSGPVIKQFIDQGVASFPGGQDVINIDALNTMLPSFMVEITTTFIDSFIMILWFTGIEILIFLVGLQKLDKSMYEAAKIDGASSWECFWKITLPALNPIIVINVIFAVIMQSMFDLNPIISKIRADMYAVEFGFGYAAAEAWIYFVILLLVLGIYVLIFIRKPSRKVKHD